MSIDHRLRAIVIGHAGAALLALSSAGAAQRAPSVPDASACDRNAACVVQIGDENRAVVDQKEARGSSASVRIDGDRNGSGTIAGGSGNLYRIASNRDVRRIGRRNGPAQDGAPIRFSVESGLIVQRGTGNRATVSITGDDNDFHVSQDGHGNRATQLVRGDRNAVAAVQTDNANRLEQTQVGDGHLAYALQSGGNNRATQVQGSSAEAALLGMGTGAGAAATFTAGYRGDTGNRMLLEQRGGNNSADLAQYGAANSIALRQDGFASIGITQQGNGHSIAIEQSAGSQGIVITQNAGG